MVSLNDKMVQYRIKNKLSMRELAKKCGVSYPTIQRIESGKTKPNRVTAAKILIVIEK